MGKLIDLITNKVIREGVKLMDDKKVLIMEYITEEECGYLCDDKLFNCESCSNFEECYINADIKCSEDFNDVFAKSVDYGGYDSEEEFWEQLMN